MKKKSIPPVNHEDKNNKNCVSLCKQKVDVPPSPYPVTRELRRGCVKGNVATENTVYIEPDSVHTKKLFMDWMYMVYRLRLRCM